MWEIVTKVQIGKLQMLDNFAEQIRDIGITTVDFSEKDAMEIFNLPLHHRDLFDRGLLAQARRLQLRLLTSDILLGSYSGLVDVLLMS